MSPSTSINLQTGSAVAKMKLMKTVRRKEMVVQNQLKPAANIKTTTYAETDAK